MAASLAVYPGGGIDHPRKPSPAPKQFVHPPFYAQLFHTTGWISARPASEKNLLKTVLGVEMNMAFAGSARYKRKIVL
jgi:hypothetical protein